MRKTTPITFAAFAVFTALSAAAAPSVKTIHGWNTWKHQNDGGKFERVTPSAELPQGAMKFLPDPGKKRYNIQWYRALPAAPTDHLRFVFTFQSASDTNANVKVSLTTRAQTQAGTWCKQTLGERRTVTVEPGRTQEISFEVDLKKCEIPDLKSLCPMVIVSNLTAGEVTFTGLKIEKVESPAN